MLIDDDPNEIISVCFLFAVEIIYLQTFEGFGPLKWKLWKNIFLMVFAVVAMFAGELSDCSDKFV